MSDKIKQASSEKVNTQGIFLNKLRVDGKTVNIFLANKTRLHGVIVGFDDYTIALEENGKQILVYKSHITTIAPHSPVKPINRA